MDDEIVFDEVTYREPRRARRPDRDRRFACLAYEVPAPGDLPIFLDRAAADAIERHALSDTSVELGGILLGHECTDDETGEPFVVVTRALEAKHYENTQASFTYTHDSWEEITRERERLHPDLDIVGWYHTHPDFGIFLSGHDLFIHQQFFARPLLVAYVVDPINGTRGFFQWREGALAQVRGYHVFAPRADRQALARTVNDLENLPPGPDAAGSGGGGGGLSPRLEAQLIAMLSRPAQHRASGPAERTQAVAVYSMLGVVLGAVLMLGATWLASLGRQVEGQAEAIRQMNRTLEDTSVAQRAALDLLVDPGGNVPGRDRLVQRYDDAKRQLVAAQASGETLALRVRELALAKERLTSELVAARAFEAKAREADRLAARLSNLEEDAKEQAARLADQERLLDADAARQTGELLRQYDRAWYVAAVGWVVAGFLVLGLIAALARTPARPDEAPDGSTPPEAEPPSHRIE